MLDKSLTDVITLVESWEMARNALPTPSSLDAILSFKKSKSSLHPRHLTITEQLNIRLQTVQFAKGSTDCSQKDDQAGIQSHIVNVSNAIKKDAARDSATNRPAKTQRYNYQRLVEHLLKYPLLEPSHIISQLSQ